MPNPVDVSNLAMLKEVIGDDLKDILESYLSTNPDLINKIQNAIQNQDARALQLHAHSLKGSSSNIGAIELPSICASLENLAKEGVVTTTANTLFAQIQSESQAVNRFLNQYMQQF